MIRSTKHFYAKLISAIFMIIIIAFIWIVELDVFGASSTKNIDIKPLALTPNHKEVIYDEVDLEDMLKTDRKAMIANFECICQYPELPSGCEVTALAMAMNYSGYKVDAMYLANNHLDKGENTNPYEKFVGDPTSSKGFGCYSSVLIKCAKSAGAFVSDVSNTSLNELFGYVENDVPVIVWGSMNMMPLKGITYKWKDDVGSSFEWKSGEHCLVLVGFDTTKAEVYLADPMYGEIKSYNMKSFYERWIDMEKMAIIVY